MLTVALTGSGAGVVAASGIDCPGVCSHAYPEGNAVSLSATPSSGSVFAGWSGACSGTGAYLVTMNSDQGVTATFAPAPAVTASGGGSTGGPVVAFPRASPPSCALAVKGNKVRLPAPSRHKARRAGALVGTLTVTARCSQAGALVLTGTIRELAGAGHPRTHAKTFRVRTLRTTARASATVTLVVRLPKAALLALGAGRRESATFELAVTNANGTSTATTRIRRVSVLRRPSNPRSPTPSGAGGIGRFEPDLAGS